jgi:hypothetical protein
MLSWSLPQGLLPTQPQLPSPHPGALCHACLQQMLTEHLLHARLHVPLKKMHWGAGRQILEPN